MVVDRRVRWVLVAAVVCAGAAGCGGAATSGSSPAVVASTPRTPDSDTPADAPTTPDDPSTTADASALTVLGTETFASTGSTETLTWSTGPLGTGPSAQPPDEALAACGLDNPLAMEENAYVPASLTISYAGSVTEPLTFPSQAVSGFDTDGGGPYSGIGPEPGIGYVVYDTDSGWNCQGPSYDFAPGTSTTLPAVIIITGAITNEHPTITANFRSRWSISSPSGFSGSTVTGPHAAYCGGPRLLLFATAATASKDFGTCTTHP